MRTNNRVFRLLTASGMLVGAGLAFDAAAQAFPNRSMLMLYPYPPGAASELVARLMTQEASKILGQGIVFENRSGANARLGLNAMQAAKPDGHTLAWSPDSIAVLQTIVDPSFKNEAGKDYAPVSLGIESYLTLTASPNVPFRDVKGFVAYAKANPGKLNFGFVPGGSALVAKDAIALASGIQFTSVPYKGAAPANTDLLNGTIDLLLSTVTAKPFVETGKLIALAVTAPKRWAPFPNAPTLMEAGIPVKYSLWFGVIAHAATPPDIIAKLNATFNQATLAPEIQKQLLQNGYNPDPRMTPEEFAAFIRREIESQAPVIRKAGIKLE